jgi:uncharacterized damage-inducible protein DinB
MTNKEFFIKVLGDERPRFRKVIESVPDDQLGYKIHEKSRDAGSLARQLAKQWLLISATAKTGKPSFADRSEPTPVSGMLADFDHNFDAMMADLYKVTDEDWENNDSTVGPQWSAKKYIMAWNFLFDAIHHRGQLTSYLRAMGLKVPAVYGPSADNQM